MLWSSAKKYFEGHRDDLVEIIYYGMTAATWNLLFNWLGDKVICLQTQDGYVSTEELYFESFLTGENSYIATVKSPGGLEFPLMIIEKDILEINMEKGEIKSHFAFDDFFSFIKSVASTVESSHYIVCPEFCPEQAFIVNGQVV